MFSASESYERFMGRWSRSLADPFVAFAELKDNQSVLDVGSGTGALASAVLAKTDRAQVLGIDSSKAYVDYARTQVQSERAKFEVGDGQQLQFSNARFDRTFSLLAMNFIPDSSKALDEMIRVTRPGGVVAAAVWDYGEGMAMLRTFWDEAVALNPSIASRDERNMPLSRSGELSAMWRKHSLVDVREQPIVITINFSSFEDFWSPFLEGQGPAGAYVASLSPVDQQKLAERLRQRLQSGATQSIRLNARAWAVRGTVPAK